MPRLQSPLRTAPFLGAAALACLAMASSRPAQAGDLAAFLTRAEKMSSLTQKVEADVVIRDSRGPETKAHLVIDPAGGGTVTYEESASGWKSETPLDWKDGKAVAKAGAASARLGIDDPLGSGDLRGIDFFPFWKTDYSKAFTSDENTQEETVSIYADEGRPYVLYVITFDKAKLMPRMIKFYRDSFNNLVRIRTDKDWVMVGSRPLPGKILMKDFAGNTLRTYEFQWKLADATGPAVAGQ